MASILIIDDEVSILTMLRAALTRAGYQVREATSGASGVQLYRDRPADVVLCDLNLAGQSGVDTLRELRSVDPRARVIAMSGAAPPLGDELSAVRVLQKPFGLGAILAVVRETLEGGSTDAPS